jgi:hypothetical protein
VLVGLIDPRVAQFLRRHHAVATTAELLALGKSDEQVRRAVERGELERRYEGVHRLAGSPSTWEQRLLIAVHAGGSGTLASHRSAAALWELDGATRGLPEVVTPRHLRGRAIDLGRVHESTDLHLAEPTMKLEIPCTGVVRTLVDLGAVVPVERLQQAIDDAIRRQLCTWEDLLHGLTVHSRRGRRGVGPLRAILEECYGCEIPDSHFNRLVERLLVAHGVPGPTVEHVVYDAHGREIGRLDLAFEPEQVGLELDSRKHHLNARAFEHDRARQNRLELNGWLILRYTWRHYSTSPGRIVTEVLAALDRRRPN